MVYYHPDKHSLSDTNNGIVKPLSTMANPAWGIWGKCPPPSSFVEKSYYFQEKTLGQAFKHKSDDHLISMYVYYA